MHLEQREEEIRGMQCVHSNAAMKFFPSWDDHWTLDDIEDTDQSYHVFCNQDIQVQTFCDQERFLAAIQTNGDVTLIFTVGRKQKFPLCSRVGCSRQVKCICYKKYKLFMKDGESEEEEDESRYYWNKRVGKKPVLVEHFLDRKPGEGYCKKHGYNRTKFEYPIKRCKSLQDKFLDRLKGIYDMPEKIVPVYDKDVVCEDHGHEYNPDDEKLILMSHNITIYQESYDRILPVLTYGRPAIGCKCVLQADTHNLLVWNMGSGQLVDYLFLHNHVHKMVSSGSAMNASFNARKTSLSSIGLQSSLSYSLFLRACTGYTQMIQFRKTDFKCDDCGDSPSYIVCDGKTDGPSKRKTEHIQELDRSERDDSVLRQGTFFTDRVFLSENRERKLVCRLLTDSLSYADFLESEEISTQNGLMVKTLVERVSIDWPDDMPKPYKRLIGNISKYSSVAGFLQVTGPEPLDILEAYCQEMLDLRSAANSDKQKIISSELPALWPNMLDILNLEKKNFLPADISSIFLKLIQIRKNTFVNAAERSSDDYVDWEDPNKEHQSQYYPHWPIFRYPKKYEVRNVTDCDFCDKAFNKHRDFTHGVFSVGCACAANITYGYELMLCR